MEVITEDGCFFSLSPPVAVRRSFPKNDCCCLPLVHSSAEELARYIVPLAIRVHA